MVVLINPVVFFISNRSIPKGFRSIENKYFTSINFVIDRSILVRPFFDENALLTTKSISAAILINVLINPVIVSFIYRDDKIERKMNKAAVF